MILTMLLTLCACGRQCGDKPSEKTPDSVPEACSAYYDYTSLEPIVSENSELPLSDDAQIGTTDHLGLWYNGEYSFIKAGGDGSYTVDELTMIDPWTKGNIKHIKNRRFIEPSVFYVNFSFYLSCSP